METKARTISKKRLVKFWILGMVLLSALLIAAVRNAQADMPEREGLMVPYIYNVTSIENPYEHQQFRFVDIGLALPEGYGGFFLPEDCDRNAEQVNVRIRIEPTVQYEGHTEQCTNSLSEVGGRSGINVLIHMVSLWKHGGVSVEGADVLFQGLVLDQHQFMAAVGNATGIESAETPPHTFQVQEMLPHIDTQELDRISAHVDLYLGRTGEDIQCNDTDVPMMVHFEVAPEIYWVSHETECPSAVRVVDNLMVLDDTLELYYQYGVRPNSNDVVFTRRYPGEMGSREVNFATFIHEFLHVAEQASSMWDNNLYDFPLHVVSIERITYGLTTAVQVVLGDTMGRCENGQSAVTINIALQSPGENLFIDEILTEGECDQGINAVGWGTYQAVVGDIERVLDGENPARPYIMSGEIDFWTQLAEQVATPPPSLFKTFFAYIGGV